MIICIKIVRVYHYIVVAYKVSGLHVGLAVCETCQNKGLSGRSGMATQHNFLYHTAYPKTYTQKHT